MKKYSLLLLLTSLLIACNPPVGPDVAGSVEGLYQLVDYRSPTVIDLVPSGTLNAIKIDNQHVLITVTGMVGKTKINYKLPSVLVTNIDRTTTSLTVKGKSVGQIVDNGTSLYVSLTPAPNITIGAMVF
ncbi:hypothetical protein GO755_24470 [Spirosoma sp. HMF4905]|uniref:Lipocalin-like domain-containing protein n=1 Tax=Spirosoma arboris TaxID=2682092 RepID=A0A7K1SHK3_9BACT|nr:hypothetical protein [Spirosoma arboris]MVM33218.1 hypothetical protein [Spirosoma arboris]